MEETPSPVTSSNDLSKQRKQSDASGKPAAIRRRSPTKPEPTTQRRQKRLERNRESARLSRRRRKQYLEVLEDRVTEHSQTMDAGRRAHVQAAVPTILDKRQQLLESGLDNVLDKLQLLQTGLARTSQELMIVGTFQTQQLRSFCTPPSTKFILWLTLQTDTYFRGGRAASERLSAARIGERVSILAKPQGYWLDRAERHLTHTLVTSLTDAQQWQRPRSSVAVHVATSLQ